jgi:hypothetical protein
MGTIGHVYAYTSNVTIRLMALAGVSLSLMLAAAIARPEGVPHGRAIVCWSCPIAMRPSGGSWRSTATDTAVCLCESKAGQ